MKQRNTTHCVENFYHNRKQDDAVYGCFDFALDKEISAITCTELDTICVTWNTHIIDKI